MIHIEHLFNFTDIKNSCIECFVKIKEIVKNHRYYIGISSNPIERLKAHIDEKRMTKMYLLCKVPTKPLTKEIETNLITMCTCTAGTKCINEGDGGEGVTNGENYVYVLVK